MDMGMGFRLEQGIKLLPYEASDCALVYVAGVFSSPFCALLLRAYPWLVGDEKGLGYRSKEDALLGNLGGERWERLISDYYAEEGYLMVELLSAQDVEFLDCALFAHLHQLWTLAKFHEVMGGDLIRASSALCPPALPVPPLKLPGAYVRAKYRRANENRWKRLSSRPLPAPFIAPVEGQEVLDA